MFDFKFGNALRIRAYVSTPGVFVESTCKAEMGDGFGVMQLLRKPEGKPGGKHGGKPGGKWKHGKASVRELETQQQWESFFFLSARET